MSWREIVVSVCLGLAVNGAFDLSPWLARRLLPFAARLWTQDAESRAAYAEEWQAIIEDRPGSLLKLGTAITFLAGGAWRSAPRLVSRLETRRPGRRLVSAALGASGAFFTLFGIGLSSWAIVSLGVSMLALATALSSLWMQKRQAKRPHS